MRLLTVVLAPTVLVLSLIASAQATGPRDVVERFFDTLEARDLAALADLFTEDVTNTLPYVATGDTSPAAMRRFEGQAAVLAYFSGAAERIAQIAFRETEIALGGDGRTVFVENRGDMVLPDGRPYRNRYVWRFEVEDGRIAGIREYFNPVTAAAASYLPMQWGLNGTVNWSAPRWIALAFTPILAIVVLACIFFLSDNPSGDGQGVPVLVAAAFLLGHGLHLWLVRRHLTP